MLRVVFLVVAAAVLFANPARATDLVGTVDKVVDGDTFWLCDAEACRKIRICGIDAPEHNQPGFNRARDAMGKLVTGRQVRCLPVGEGTPCDGRSRRKNRDRIVAQCFVGEIDLGVPMVTGGFACDWVRYSGGHYSKHGGRICPVR